VTPNELADWLCRRLGVERTAVEPVLGDALERAASDWPDVDLPLAAFGDFLLERLEGVGDIEQELAVLELSDLYLACALARGDARALRRFDAKILSAIEPALARVVETPLERAEIAQRIREKLFVAEPPRPPRIEEYRGHGDLRSWVAVVGVRIALNEIRSRKREKLVDPSSLGEASFATEDPELLAIRREVRSDFEQAVRKALGRISVRQRNLLRHYFLDRLGIDQLGAIYGVHRATAARWVSQARAQVREETRSILIESSRLRAPEADSVMRMLDSQLELSLGGLFRTGTSSRD
jgi:RNA polymerase sigma-70 factor, ECF subfamily